MHVERREFFFEVYCKENYPLAHSSYMKLVLKYGLFIWKVGDISQIVFLVNHNSRKQFFEVAGALYLTHVNILFTQVYLFQRVRNMFRRV